MYNQHIVLQEEVSHYSKEYESTCTRVLSQLQIGTPMICAMY